MGSYNYLGFAAADEYCTPRVIDSMKKFSPSTCSTRTDGGSIIITWRHVHIYIYLFICANLVIQLGTTTLHTELEECVADFVGKPAALVTGMGYATNSAILPSLIGKVLLIYYVTCTLHHSGISHLI